MCTGIVLFIVGPLVNQAERHGLAIPRFVTWSFVALILIGVVVMPISGIWLLIPPAAAMAIRLRASTEV
jgi:hypothetical protein